MSLGKTLTSFGAAAAIALAPKVAQSNEHHNHAVLGVEANTHSVMAHGGYFHEVGGHVSLGLAAGLGKSFHGETVGSFEGLVAYHATLSHAVAEGIFAVLEGGAGLEVASVEHEVHMEPVLKATSLVGVQVTPTVGIFVGPSYIRTPDANHWSASAGVVLGF